MSGFLNHHKNMDARYHINIKVGATVEIVLKADQKTGKLTKGVVARLLTKNAYHTHGIKVQLTDGQVGRVKHVL